LKDDKGAKEPSAQKEVAAEEKNSLRRVFLNILGFVVRYLDKYRFFRFAIVGGMGVPINLGILVVLKEIGLHYVAAVILATEITMTINYLLNNYWTFSNRKINIFKGWAKYALISLPFDGTSFALTVTLKETVLSEYYWGYLMAAGAGLLVAMILRYVTVKRFVWRGRSTPKNPEKM
jgi:dolichol-phosphate mannosyltransferase